MEFLQTRHAFSVPARCLFLGGGFKFPQGRHGGGGGVFALAAFLSPFGLAGVMILSHESPTLLAVGDACPDWVREKLPETLKCLTYHHCTGNGTDDCPRSLLAVERRASRRSPFHPRLHPGRARAPGAPPAPSDLTGCTDSAFCLRGARCLAGSAGQSTRDMRLPSLPTASDTC